MVGYIPGTFLGTRETLLPKIDNIPVLWSWIIFAISIVSMLTCCHIVPQPYLYHRIESLQQPYYHLYFSSQENDNTEEFEYVVQGHTGREW